MMLVLLLLFALGRGEESASETCIKQEFVDLALKNDFIAMNWLVEDLVRMTAYLLTSEQLTAAACRGHTETVYWLLSKGVEEDDTRTALQCAAVGGHVGVLRLLVGRDQTRLHQATMLAMHTFQDDAFDMLRYAGGDVDSGAECYNPSKYALEGTYEELDGVLPTCTDYIMDMLLDSVRAGRSFHMPASAPIKVDIVGMGKECPDSVGGVEINLRHGSMPPYYVMEHTEQDDPAVVYWNSWQPEDDAEVVGLAEAID